MCIDLSYSKRQNNFSIRIKLYTSGIFPAIITLCNRYYPTSSYIYSLKGSKSSEICISALKRGLRTMPKFRNISNTTYNTQTPTSVGDGHEFSESFLDAKNLYGENFLEKRTTNAHFLK